MTGPTSESNDSSDISNNNVTRANNYNSDRSGSSVKQMLGKKEKNVKKWFAIKTFVIKKIRWWKKIN